MPSTVITTAATVVCTHNGVVALANAPGPVRLRVAGTPVALADGVSLWLVKAVAADPQGCPATAPNGNPSPCLTVSTPTAGRASKLRVGGVPVLLRTLSAPAVGSTSTSPPPPFTVSVSEVASTKLAAV